MVTKIFKEDTGNEIELKLADASRNYADDKKDLDFDNDANIYWSVEFKKS